MTPARTPERTRRRLPRLNGLDGNRPYDEIEHLVDPAEPDVALCGVDQTDVPWNQGLPPCQACVEISRGALS